MVTKLEIMSFDRCVFLQNQPQPGCTHTRWKKKRKKRETTPGLSVETFSTLNRMLICSILSAKASIVHSVIKSFVYRKDRRFRMSNGYNISSLGIRSMVFVLTLGEKAWNRWEVADAGTDEWEVTDNQSCEYNSHAKLRASICFPRSIFPRTIKFERIFFTSLSIHFT